MPAPWSDYEEIVMPDGALTLESAIQKVTQMPARKLRIAGRGVLRVGAFADLAAFDPSTVADQASFDIPYGRYKRFLQGALHRIPAQAVS